MATRWSFWLPEEEVLFVDDRQQCVTSLVRMQAEHAFSSAPAARRSPEEVYLLEGDLIVEGQRMKPGDYCRAETTSIHGESYTASGCLFSFSKASQHDQIIG